jgi:hypothetical protein
MMVFCVSGRPRFTVARQQVVLYCTCNDVTSCGAPVRFSLVGRVGSMDRPPLCQLPSVSCPGDAAAAAKRLCWGSSSRVLLV